MGQDASKTPAQPEQTKAKLDPSDLLLTKKPIEDGSIDEYVEETSEGQEINVAEVPLTQGKELADIENNDPVDEYLEDDQEPIQDVDYAEQPLLQGQELAEIEKNDPVDEYLTEVSEKKEVSDVQGYQKELQQGKQFNELSSQKEESDDMQLLQKK